MEYQFTILTRTHSRNLRNGIDGHLELVLNDENERIQVPAGEYRFRLLDFSTFQTMDGMRIVRCNYLTDPEPNVPRGYQRIWLEIEDPQCQFIKITIDAPVRGLLTQWIEDNGWRNRSDDEDDVDDSLFDVSDFESDSDTDWSMTSSPWM